MEQPKDSAGDRRFDDLQAGADGLSANSPDTRPTINVQARAKINLALAVGMPTPTTDGYHPIASWMARLDLADDVQITMLDDDRFSRYAILWHKDAPVRSPIDWSITKDLAVRAHLLLEHATGRTLPIQLKLDKRIPVGGGLGGASADAAAMLLAVNELYELGLSRGELVDIAMQLGSDVAYCLNDEPAFVAGLGERVEVTPSVRSSVVLVLPEFGCHTGKVYGAFDASPPAEFREGTIEDMAFAGVLDAHELFNDLTVPARAIAPRLSGIVERCEDVADGLPVVQTGSGSTQFIICPKGEAQAAMLAKDINAEVQGVRTLVSHIG